MSPNSFDFKQFMNKREKTNKKKVLKHVLSSSQSSSREVIENLEKNNNVEITPYNFVMIERKIKEANDRMNNNKAITDTTVFKTHITNPSNKRPKIVFANIEDFSTEEKKEK